MFYAILCHHSERALAQLSEAEDAAMMDGLYRAQAQIAAQGRLGPVARLRPTGSAVTLRQRGSQVIVDGPFAETKEQLLGFWLVEAESMEQAIELARPLAHGGTLEIRPVLEYFPPGSVVGAPARDELP